MPWPDLQPGVLNDEESHQLDSFNPALDGLLDCPHYTRPETWEGQAVPEVAAVGASCADRALAPRPPA
jgi:tRNA (guanine37-N1)-methyltransferase